MSEDGPAIPDEVTKVARTLTSIETLAADLEDQAVHKASNPENLPGGAAMVALAPVASPEAWENVFEAAERWNADPKNRVKRPTDHIAEEDEDWAPPLQTVLFWSEQWRVQHNRESDRRPDLASEVAFIRQILNWAWENEPHFDDFAADMRTVRRRLENVLYAGTRVERGAPCMYDECNGARLVRHIDDQGERSDWQCPRCDRRWNEDAYWQNVRAANEKAQAELIGDVTWCSVDYAARAVQRPVKTVRTWVNRGLVSVACIIAGRRTRFVNLEQVREQDELARRRRRRAA